MNILAIKGGGARGVIVTRFLVEIEKITGYSIAQLFDYIGGSSVGALVTCGLLVSDDGINPKYTAQEVHDIFIKNMANAFSWTYGSWIGSVFGLFGPSYTNIGLIKIIDYFCSDKTLGSLLKPIIFPAYDRMTHKAYYFEREKDIDLHLRNVIMSCTAAPIYFPSYTMEIKDRKYDMIDGGIVVNNTAELVFLQATKNMQCIDKSKILELNIGTGLFPNTTTEKHGLLTWLPMIVDTLMHACNENELFELSLSLPQDNYFIMDVPLDIKYYYIDDVRKESINYYIKETDKWIEENQESIMIFCHKLLKNKGFDIPENLRKLFNNVSIKEIFEDESKLEYHTFSNPSPKICISQPDSNENKIQEKLLDELKIEEELPMDLNINNT
jgi:predicted acylesterase/phospholipase RssA